jgi:hypothetical protein
MSDGFKDNKGIRHNFQFTANLANQQYVQEENENRERMVNLQKAQIELQNAQIEIQRENSKEQENHNARLRNIAEAEAEAAQVKREFEKDVLWLEKCDSDGRFKYLSEKVTDVILVSSIEVVNNRCIDTYSRIPTQEITKVLNEIQRINELNETIAELKSNLIYKEERLDYLNNKTAPETGLVASLLARKVMTKFYLALTGLCGLLPIGVLPFIFNNNDKDSKFGTNLVAGIIIFVIASIPALFFYLVYRLLSNKSKSESEDRKENRRLKEQLLLEKEVVKTQVTKLDKDFREKTTAFKKFYSDWHLKFSRSLNDNINKLKHDEEMIVNIKRMIAKVEAGYPNSLHINWGNVNPNNIAKFIDDLLLNIMTCSSRQDDDWTIRCFAKEIQLSDFDQRMFLRELIGTPRVDLGP